MGREGRGQKKRGNAWEAEERDVVNQGPEINDKAYVVIGASCACAMVATLGFGCIYFWNVEEPLLAAIYGFGFVVTSARLAARRKP